MSKLKFFPADILLPKNGFETWSVIACDQYTSQPEYWAEVESTVGDRVSALNIILPEVYLSTDNSERIGAINRAMTEYLNSGVFDTFENSYIYIERTLKNGKTRRGILGLIDLEDYSYEKNADTPIRATEETVKSRIPPRVEIRKDAPLEMPHIMLLLDDPSLSVIEPVTEKTGELKKLYDFSLMQNGGSIKGYLLNETVAEQMQTALTALDEAGDSSLLFAVGDGNHSLATAKECYKSGFGSRYAMVEVVNIHDTSLEFEPIYRVLFDCEPETVLTDMLEALGGEYFGEDRQEFICLYGNKEKHISLKPTGKLAVATLQAFLDSYIKEKGIRIDYIHGRDSLKALCSKENTLGFLFDGMTKSELFTAVACDGSLPRKTFSMGCADDKRFYLEARKIK